MRQIDLRKYAGVDPNDETVQMIIWTIRKTELPAMDAGIFCMIPMMPTVRSMRYIHRNQPRGIDE